MSCILMTSIHYCISFQENLLLHRLCFSVTPHSVAQPERCYVNIGAQTRSKVHSSLFLYLHHYIYTWITFKVAKLQFAMQVFGKEAVFFFFFFNLRSPMVLKVLRTTAALDPLRIASYFFVCFLVFFFFFLHFWDWRAQTKLYTCRSHDIRHYPHASCQAIKLLFADMFLLNGLLCSVSMRFDGELCLSDCHLPLEWNKSTFIFSAPPQPFSTTPTRFLLILCYWEV